MQKLCMNSTYTHINTHMHTYTLSSRILQSQAFNKVILLSQLYAFLIFIATPLIEKKAEKIMPSVKSISDGKFQVFDLK